MLTSMRCACAVAKATGQTAVMIALLAGSLASTSVSAASPPSYPKIFNGQVITDAVPVLARPLPLAAAQ